MIISVNVDVEMSKEEIEQCLGQTIDWDDNDNLYSSILWRMEFLVKEGFYMRDDLIDDDDILAQCVGEAYRMALSDIKD